MRRGASALLCALLATAAAAAPGDATFSPSTQQKIEAVVRSDLASYGGNEPVPGVVIGVWYPGHGTFVRSIGYGELSPRRVMTLDDRFRIGSNTKTFLVSVLLQLVDEKKLGLDDPVSRFALPVHVPNGTHITVRELMEMRSGIVDLYANPAFQTLDIKPAGPFDRVPWVTWALKHRPLFAPGTKYSYSNTNYMLLGWIAEVVGRDSVPNLIRRRIIVPLGLHATSFPVTDPGMPAPYAHGYSLDAKRNWFDTSVVFPPAATWAAGAMISDMADMKTWVKAYVTGTTNGARTQRERLKCLPTGARNLSFGLGIGCAAGWYGYTGGIEGYNTCAYYLPGKDATIIAFVNSHPASKGKPHVAAAIVRDIAKIVFPENVPYQ